MNVLRWTFLALTASAWSQPATAPDLPRAYAAARARAEDAFADAPGEPPYEDEGPGSPESEDADAAPRGFRLVSTGLYRSAQPKRGNLAWLARFGVRTILDLRDPVVARVEKAVAAEYGLALENVAMSGLRAPSFDRLDRALAVLTDPRVPRPILVHCLHGEDRTGVVIAAYRAAIEGVPPVRAAEEARALGCCHAVTPDLDGLLARYLAYRAAARR